LVPLLGCGGESPSGAGVVRISNHASRKIAALTQIMMSNTDRDGGIDRRTALSLLSGGVAALAGCSGDSSSGSSEGTDSGDTELEYPGSGWIEPAEQSEYITGSEIVADDDTVYLELQLQNAVDIFSINLIDTQNNEFSYDLPDAGEVQIALAKQSSEDAPTIVSGGENTLVIEFDDESVQRIPFRLGTSLQLRGIERVDNELQITVENTGNHPTTTLRTECSNVPGESDGKLAPPSYYPLNWEVIRQGETQTLTILNRIWRPVPLSICDDLSSRTLEFTVRPLWAKDITFSQRVNYAGSNCGSLEGEPTVTTGQSTEAGDK